MIPDVLTFALPVALGAAAFIGLAAATVFRYIEPSDVVADYDGGGGWHEAELMCPGSNGPTLCRVPQQPINTYSNLVYVIWGVGVAASVGTGPAWVFALAMTYLCLGSMLYHATSAEWAHVADETGMYGVYTSLAIYAVATALGVGAPWTATAMGIGAGVAAFGFGSLFVEEEGVAGGRRHLAESPYRDWVLGGLLVITVAVCLLEAARTRPYLVAAVVLFALAYGIWRLDRARRFPRLGGRAWGHGVWHFLTAPATALLYAAVRASGM